MKNILLLVHDDAGQEARLQAALDLARSLDGHLTCVDVAQIPVLVENMYDGLGTAMLLADERAHEAANKERLTARLRHEDIAWDWQDSCGDLAECILDAARTADLIVVNRALDRSSLPDMPRIAGQILTGSEALLVAVPPHAKGFGATGKALIAWNGSNRAMNTVRRAIPLLHLAGAVKLVQVGEAKGDVPLEEAASYLSRHGIVPVIQYLPGGGNVAELLAAEARVWHASYCVMGAFDHSRMTEAIFGGVTRSMLKASSIPLVMGH